MLDFIGEAPDMMPNCNSVTEVQWPHAELYDPKDITRVKKYLSGPLSDKVFTSF